MTLLYDGSFEGFLTAVYDAFYRRGADGPNEAATIKKADNGQLDLCETAVVETSGEKSEKVTAAIEQKLGQGLIQTIYKAWMCEEDGIEDALLHYLRVGFRQKRNPADMLYDRDIKAVLSAAGRVGAEAGKFVALLRFHKVGEGSYLADIEPIFRILPLVADHFADRFGDQMFVIRDLRHRMAVVYDLTEWYMTELSEEECVPYTGRDEYVALWKTYYKTICIKERRNLKLQQHFIPKKWRKHLVEMQP